MNTYLIRKATAKMDHMIEDMLRQRKLLLWRKILETFPIEKAHRDRITKKILPQPVADLPQHIEQQKSDAEPDCTPTAPRCSEIDT
jgi:hypothetical protein